MLALLSSVVVEGKKASCFCAREMPLSAAPSRPIYASFRESVAFREMRSIGGFEHVFKSTRPPVSGTPATWILLNIGGGGKHSHVLHASAVRPLSDHPRENR